MNGKRIQSSLPKNYKIKWFPLNHFDRRFKSKTSFIPPPSWSIKDLRLSDTNMDDDKSCNDHANDIVSNSTLETLAKCSYIDLNQLRLDRRIRLEEDLKGIMRCLSVLVDGKNNKSRGLEDLSLTDEDIYDLPRGLNDLNSVTNDSLDIFQTDEDIEKHDPKYVTDRLQYKLTKATVKSNDSEEDEDGLFFSVVTKNKNDNH